MDLVHTLIPEVAGGLIVAALTAPIGFTVGQFQQRRAERRQHDLTVETIYTSVLDAIRIASAALTHRQLTQATQDMLVVIETQLGPVLGICRAVGGPVGRLQKTLSRGPACEPPDATQVVVRGLPDATLELSSALHGEDVERLDCHCVEIRMILQELQRNWAEAGERKAEIRAAQKVLTRPSAPRKRVMGH